MKLLTKDQYYKSLNRSKFRVKIKSLADEARVIRREVKKTKGHYWVDGDYVLGCVGDQLTSHNRNVVRVEQRHTLLAYAFYRGVPYSVVEKPSENNKPNISHICRILKSLTYNDYPSGVQKWLKGESLVAEKQSA